MLSKGAASGSASDDCPERDGLSSGVLGIAEAGKAAGCEGNHGSLGSFFPIFVLHN